MTTDAQPSLHGLLLSGDLLFASQATGVFAQLGGQLHETVDVTGAIAACAEFPIALVLVDLTMPGFDAARFVQQVRSALSAPPPLVAYGPHVRAQLLSAARDAGFDAVYTRGQVHAELREILAKHTA